ncbi:MAG: molybdate ABC transporter permease subunit [Fibrobacteres bacterium]|jgi:molybdate transport system permease protein|nr:molybdate ABC transporter permease subunit [Fibrobacterota bacterium]
MSSLDLEPIWLTLKLSAATCAILILLAVPLAWGLAQAPARWRLPLHALVSMPLVLPPSVLGFYLLVAFSPENAFGHFLKTRLHLSIAFTFTGLVIGSVIFSLPFMVNPLLSGFDGLPPSLTEAAYVLGKSRWTTLLRVSLPNLKPALLSGIALTFAHTMGEFGVVLMIGGKIPGVTKVASIAVFDEVESLRFGNAHVHALILFVLSFAILITLFAVNRKKVKPF